MNLGNVVQHIRETSKHFGPGAALYELEYRGVNHLVPMRVLRGMALELEQAEPALFTPNGFEARFCSRSELVLALGDAEVASQMSLDFVHRALGRGDACHGIFEGDRLVNFGWYSQRPTSIESDLVLHFDPKWTYAYKTYTLEAYRGRRLNGLGLCLAACDYVVRGSRGLVLYVEANNYPSLRSTAHLGCEIFGNLYVARAFGRALTWSTPGCAEYGFQLEWTGPKLPELRSQSAAQGRS